MEIFYTTTCTGDIHDWVKSIYPPSIPGADKKTDYFVEFVIQAVKTKLREKEVVTLAAEVDEICGYRWDGPCLRRLFIDGRVFYKLF